MAKVELALHEVMEAGHLVLSSTAHSANDHLAATMPTAYETAGLELVDLARGEGAATEEAAAAGQLKREQELQEAIGERLDSARRFQAELSRACAVVPRLLELDGRCQDLGVRAGKRTKSLREAIATLAVIALRDAGLDDPVPYVVAAQGLQIVREFPTRETPRVGRKCATCAHPEAAAIDELLATGAPLREIAKRFAVSSSALSRHRAAHLGAAA